MVAGVAAVGEYANYADTVTAVLDTLVYTVPEGNIPFSTEDEAFTLEYPAAWTAIEMMGTVALFNDAAIMGWDYESPLESGWAMIYIFLPYDRAIEAETIAEEAAQFAEYTIQGENLTLGEPVEMTLNDLPAVRIDYTSDLGEGYLVAVDVEGENLYVQVQVATGELADYEAEIAPILETIKYTPPAE